MPRLMVEWPSSDAGLTNEYRAKMGNALVTLIDEMYEGDPNDNLCDALADIMHSRGRATVMEATRRAASHHREETIDVSKRG